MSQPASAPPPAQKPTNVYSPPAPAAPRPAPQPRQAPTPQGPVTAAPHRASHTGAGGTTRSASGGEGGSVQSVGAFAPGGNGSAAKAGHPAQAYSGIGSPSGHRAWAVAIAKHAMAGAAGVREADAMLRREIKRAPMLSAAQRAKASWRLKRAHRRLAGACEAEAKAAANVAKVRAEVNQDILSAKQKRRTSGFTVT